MNIEEFPEFKELMSDAAREIDRLEKLVLNAYRDGCLEFAGKDISIEVIKSRCVEYLEEGRIL